MFRWSFRLQLARRVWEADDRGVVSDVEKTFVEHDTEGSGAICRKRCERLLSLRDAVPVRVAKNDDLTEPTLGHEHVAVGCQSDPSRVLETLGENVDVEARRNLQMRSIRLGNDSRDVPVPGRVEWFG